MATNDENIARAGSYGRCGIPTAPTIQRATKIAAGTSSSVRVSHPYASRNQKVTCATNEATASDPNLETCLTYKTHLTYQTHPTDLTH